MQCAQVKIFRFPEFLAAEGSHMTQVDLRLRGSPQATESLVQGERPKWKVHLALLFLLLPACYLNMVVDYDKVAPVIHASLYSHRQVVPCYIESGLPGASL